MSSRIGAERVALVYPGNRLEAGTSLGLHALYRLFSERCRVSVVTEEERHFPACDLAVATVSFESQYRTLVEMTDGRDVPLVVGGVLPSGNPRVPAAFADVVCVGDAEVIVPSLYERLAGGAPLDALADEPWALLGEASVPPPGVARLDDMSRTAAFSAFGGDNAFNAELLVELGRSCTGRCAFCLLTGVSGRPRFVPLGTVNALLERVRPRSVALVAGALADYPHLDALLERLAADGVRVGVSSLQAGRVSKRVLALLARCGARSITLAPECGDEALRRAVGKPVPDERFAETLSAARETGITSAKLYFVLGLTEEPLAEAEQALAFIERVNPLGVTLHFSFSLFVPKPHTPFAAKPLVSRTQARAARRLLERALKSSAKFEGWRSAHEQALISLGDEAVGRALVLAVREGITLRRAMGCTGAGEGAG